MADIAHVFGDDLTVDLTGDLLTSDSDPLTQQRLLRRLLTCLGGYIWQPSYGAGLGSMVGSPVAIQHITGVIKQQLLSETSVSRSPEPVIQIQADASGTVFATVTYQSAVTGAAVSLTIPG